MSQDGEILEALPECCLNPSAGRTLDRRVDLLDAGPSPAGWWRRPRPWGGRIDDPDDPLAQRWHQLVGLWDGSAPKSFMERQVRGGVDVNSVVWLVGCCTDLGVRRNKGRPGAANGPAALRRAMANLPGHHADSLRLVDAGDLVPDGEDLDGYLEALAGLVAAIRAGGGLPVLLGGGHEIAYATHRGLLSARRAADCPRIVSFDAHFDLRPEGPPGRRHSSGNMFSCLAAEYGRGSEAGRLAGSAVTVDSATTADPPAPVLDYVAVGIQQSGNTRSLFREAERLGVRWLPARNCGNPDRVLDFLRHETADSKTLHVSLCLDVIRSAHVPAVSAPQPFGLEPECVLEGLRWLAATGRLAALDIAELSPRYPEDASSAHMAAILLFAVVNTLAPQPAG